MSLPPKTTKTAGRQRTPLHCAAKGNTTAVARYLISVGANTEARTAYKMTPLHVAAFYGSAAVLRMLLEEVHDLDIDALDFGSCEICFPVLVRHGGAPPRFSLAPFSRFPSFGLGTGVEMKIRGRMYPVPWPDCCALWLP